MSQQAPNIVTFRPSEPTQLAFEGHGLSRIPNKQDEEVERFIESMLDAGPDVVLESSTRASEKGRQILQAYANRMSSLAVRIRDPLSLKRALVALVIGGLDRHEREALMMMPLIENSARQLGLNLEELFDEMAAVVGSQRSASFSMWLSRSPEDRTLESMRLVEGEDEDGFRYRLEW